MQLTDRIVHLSISRHVGQYASSFIKHFKEQLHRLRNNLADKKPQIYHYWSLPLKIRPVINKDEREKLHFPVIKLELILKPQTS